MRGGIVKYCPPYWPGLREHNHTTQLHTLTHSHTHTLTATCIPPLTPHHLIRLLAVFMRGADVDAISPRAGVVGEDAVDQARASAVDHLANPQRADLVGEGGGEWFWVGTG